MLAWMIDKGGGGAPSGKWEHEEHDTAWRWRTRAWRMGRRGRRKSYLNELGRTEAGASVEPVVVAQLVDLDAAPVGLLSLMRHCLRHHRLIGVPSVGRDAIVVREEVGRNVEVLLQGEFGLGFGRIAEDGKRRHFGRGWARDSECARWVSS